jgi:ribosomal protein S27AE
MSETLEKLLWVERDMFITAGKVLAEEYEDRRSQFGSEYLWQKHEDADCVNAAIAIFTSAQVGNIFSVDDMNKEVKKDSQSCPECDALASHGSNDGPCETHKL